MWWDRGSAVRTLDRGSRSGSTQSVKRREIRAPSVLASPWGPASRGDEVEPCSNHHHSSNLAKWSGCRLHKHGSGSFLAVEKKSQTHWPWWKTRPVRHTIHLPSLFLFLLIYFKSNGTFLETQDLGCWKEPLYFPNGLAACNFRCSNLFQPKNGRGEDSSLRENICGFWEFLLSQSDN